jgi:hypothetical protein
MSRRRKLAILLGVGALIAGAGAYWFEPWKLFVDARVSDEAPALSGEANVRILSEGAFRSLEHETTGTARIVELANGNRVLRFEDLVTSNGPQLVVMLSATPATESGWSAYDDGPYVILAPLKGNLGSQNYPIPADVDLGAYESAVVWCKRFSVGFGAASIAGGPPPP